MPIIVKRPIALTIPAASDAPGVVVSGAYEPWARGTFAAKPHGRFFQKTDGSLTGLYPGWTAGPLGFLPPRVYLNPDRRVRMPSSAALAAPIDVTNTNVGGAGSWEAACTAAYARTDGAVIRIADGIQLHERTMPARPNMPTIPTDRTQLDADGLTPTAYSRIWVVNADVPLVTSATPAPAPTATNARINAEGVRLTPAQGVRQPGFQQAQDGVASSLIVQAGCYGVRFIGIAFTMHPLTAPEVQYSSDHNGCVALQQGAYDIMFEQCYGDGRANDGINCNRIVISQAGTDALIDCWLDPNNREANDTQSYLALNGHPGPHLCVGNYLSGLGETWGSPGDSAGQFADVECRRNMMHHPMRFCIWAPQYLQIAKPLDTGGTALTVLSVSSPVNDSGTTSVNDDTRYYHQVVTFSRAFTGSPAVAGEYGRTLAVKSDGSFVELYNITSTTASVRVHRGVTDMAGWAPGNTEPALVAGDTVTIKRAPRCGHIKNLGELKDAAYVTMQENIHENAWRSDIGNGQYWAVAAKGSAYCRVKEFTMADSLLLNVCGGIAFSAIDDYQQTGDLITRNKQADNCLVLQGDPQLLSPGVEDRMRAFLGQSNTTWFTRLAVGTVAPSAGSPGASALILLEKGGQTNPATGQPWAPTPATGSGFDACLFREGSGGFALDDGGTGTGFTTTDQMGYPLTNCTAYHHTTGGSYSAGTVFVAGDQSAVYTAPSADPSVWDYSTKAGTAQATAGQGLRDWTRLKAVYDTVRPLTSVLPREY